ncbi:hypothetical protein [Halomonas sp. IOP_31]|uniref:hypothetical protein n=1 Tax=Halomonas sp. IOP_31 TaxID=2876584 RepID=UPI001E50E421|nr:hypothetical protein [Halomonas sp. IOP_31]MCD6007110.1 hypothetical protein [Halomonas sp. IOP_31]
MNSPAEAVKTSSEVPMQTPSQAIWDAKYRLKDRHGTPVDKDVADTWERVARGLAQVEGEQRAAWLPRFRWALEAAGRSAAEIDHDPLNCRSSPTSFLCAARSPRA